MPDLPRSIGSLIRAARQSAGYTLGQLASFLNMSPADLSDVELGNRQASATLIDRVTAAVKLRSGRGGRLDV